MGKKRKIWLLGGGVALVVFACAVIWVDYNSPDARLMRDMDQIVEEYNFVLKSDPNDGFVNGRRRIVYSIPDSQSSDGTELAYRIHELCESSSLKTNVHGAEVAFSTTSHNISTTATYKTVESISIFHDTPGKFVLGTPISLWINQKQKPSLSETIKSWWPW